MFRINSLHPPAAAGAGLPSTIEEAVEATDTAGLPSTIEEATFEEVMESLVMEHADQLGHTDQLHHQLEHVHQAGKNQVANTIVDEKSAADQATKRLDQADATNADDSTNVLHGTSSVNSSK